MPKLHQILAVEGDLRAQAESCRADLKNTFEKKGHHFSKKLVTFKPLADGEPAKTEAQLDLQTTVKKELEWISVKLSKEFDAGYQIDVANTQANADVVMEDGTVLLKSVPTTALLRLEKRITEIRDLVHKIPTLDPSKGFAPDVDQGAGVFKAREVTSTRTAKQFSFRVMVPATDKHPAQVKELMEDVPTGTVVTQEWSSLITVAEKGDMLDRVEDLLRAVKKARSKANDMDLDVASNKIGAAITNFVFGTTV